MPLSECLFHFPLLIEVEQGLTCVEVCRFTHTWPRDTLTLRLVVRGWLQKEHTFILSLLHLSLDLYEHKFINCRFINSTFLQQKEGCHLDFEQDNDFLIYLVSFLGSLSVLPGNIISALLMDRIGRLKMIGELSGTAHLCSRGPGKGLRVC